MPLVSRLPPAYSGGDNLQSQTPEGGLRTESSPGNYLFAITKSDVTTYSPPLRAIYVGGAGDVALVAVGQSAGVTFTACPVGLIIPVNVSQVLSTGTSATLLVGIR